MKTKLQLKPFSLALALATAFSLNAARGSTIFPIATNASVVEFGGGLLFDGTNYMAGLMSGTNVNMQRFSANGTLLGPPLNVGANPGFPPVVGFALGQTNYLAVWSDHSISSGVDLFGQFVSRSGVKVGGPFNLLASQGAHGFQTVAAIASDGTNFLVVWQDESNRNFYGQLVTPAGTLSGSEFSISSQLQNGTSAAATFGKTNYLVAWQSSNGSQGDVNKTYGAFVSMSGVAGGPFQITTVRVLKCGIGILAFIYKGWMHEGGCERLEVFMRFSPSTFFAKLPGCTPESSYSPNSPT